MIFTQGRSQGAHDVAEPHLVRRDHVGVALDHRHPARLSAGGPGEVGRVENRALLEEDRLGAVEIFCDMLPLGGHRSLDLRQNSSAESDRPAPFVMNRKDQPTPKSLAHGPGRVFRSGNQSRLLEHLSREPVLPRLENQPAPLDRRIPQPKPLDARRVRPRPST